MRGVLVSQGKIKVPTRALLKKEIDEIPIHSRNAFNRYHVRNSPLDVKGCALNMLEWLHGNSSVSTMSIVPKLLYI